MKTNFIIHQGEISFMDNLIKINDKNSKWSKPLLLFSGLCAVLYGILIIIKYFKTNDPFDLWPGIILVTLGIPSLILNQIRITFVNQIQYRDIKKVIIKYTFLNQYIAVFALSNSKKRRVILDQNDEGRFEKFSLKDFINALNANDVIAEIK